jgi:hypothetical protein
VDDPEIVEDDPLSDETGNGDVDPADPFGDDSCSSCVDDQQDVSGNVDDGEVVADSNDDGGWSGGDDDDGAGAGDDDDGGGSGDDDDG